MSTTHVFWRRNARHVARLLVAAVAAAVVLLVACAVAALVTGELPGGGSWTVLPVTAAAVAGALLWPRGRTAADAVTARVLLGSAPSPEDVVRTFGRRESRELSDEELLIQLAESLVRSLRASSAEIWRDSGDGHLNRAAGVPHRAAGELVLTASSRRVLIGGGVVGRAWAEMWQPEIVADRPPGDIRLVPVTHGGELLGLVVVTRMASADRFSADDDAVLADIGARLGVLLHNRALDATLQDTFADLRATNAELRASRARLVTTADAERRRIERNLHDGAQQHLVALAVNLRLATNEITADPSTAPALLATLGNDVRDAINELRTLAHGIYPPLLMDAGLVEALRVSARRSPAAVTLDVGTVHRYPTEIEAATYFCCMEALQNAAKHAPGAQVRLGIHDDGTTLRFVVEDDGPGIAPDAVQPGHGLGNMLDRMVAVGGDVAIESGHAHGEALVGTRIVGTIPVGGR